MAPLFSFYIFKQRNILYSLFYLLILKCHFSPSVPMKRNLPLKLLKCFYTFKEIKIKL